MVDGYFIDITLLAVGICYLNFTGEIQIALVILNAEGLNKYFASVIHCYGLTREAGLICCRGKVERHHTESISSRKPARGFRLDGQEAVRRSGHHAGRIFLIPGIRRT